MAHSVLHCFKRINLPVVNVCNELFGKSLRIQSRGYAVKKQVTKGKGKGMVKEAFKAPEVCKDPVRLCTHAVGVNVFKQGDDPFLKPKEEYPEWLFQLDLGPPKKISDLEPDSWEYLKLLRKEHIWRQNKLNKAKKM
ncbi:39S ribosomal protein L54, mitochondrial [Puntigrus tetrazona]|uniref:39S ribosomal protein L54, mitochondrial n=1 Tax=Puntigrus tetrazona TaxID=1606681 RepID=UPI001C898AD2|nr:39S ribosomal protein L54, mitochondrial [Puntigrus tetrazona]